MKPSQGTTYTTGRTDTLSKISLQAYGTPSKTTLIEDVNQFQQTYTVDELLSVGQSIIIPYDTDLKALRDEQLNRGLAGVRN